MFWFMDRVDVVTVVFIDNPTESTACRILVCSYVNVCEFAPKLLAYLSFLLQATTLYPSKRKVSDTEGEFYFRYAAFEWVSELSEFYGISSTTRLFWVLSIYSCNFVTNQRWPIINRNTRTWKKNCIAPRPTFFFYVRLS